MQESRRSGGLLLMFGALAAVGFGMIANIAALSAAAPLGLLVFLVTAYYGWSLWRKGREPKSEASP